MILARHARRACLVVAFCYAPGAALADPAFLSFALTPTRVSIEPVSAGFEDFAFRAAGDPFLAVGADFTLTPTIDVPPLRAASRDFDRPSRPGLAARRLVFEAPAQPQIEFKRGYARSEGVMP